jgi:hypothetical protein
MPTGLSEAKFDAVLVKPKAQGDALMEAMTVPHFGTDTGAQPVRLLIVYMGAEGVPNAIPER